MLTMHGVRSRRKSLHSVCVSIDMKIPASMIPTLMRAYRLAEEEIERTIPLCDAIESLSNCVRKLGCIGKDIDYLPLLYRCELPMFMTMKEITSQVKEVPQYV